MITYAGLCKKLGFDLREYFTQDESNIPDTDETNDEPSVFSKLSLEELEFIRDKVLIPLRSK